MKEPFLEPILRKWRFQEGLKHIPLDNELVLVDLGCGPAYPFYSFALKQRLRLKKYIGIDPLLKQNYERKNIRLLKAQFVKSIPLQAQLADIVVAFAVLEHIDNPKKLIAEIIRVLKPKGKAIITTPTPQAKTILEWLAFKLKWISAREIAEHKQYFDRDTMKTLVKNARVISQHHYFEFGFNNLLLITKTK